MNDSAQAIQALRAASNAAIAARDADRVVSFMTDNVSVAVANGPTLRGRDASRKAFAEQFADRTFVKYVRTPDYVDVNNSSAKERGRWVGTWRTKIGDHEMSGTYSAEWERTEIGWLIKVETYL